MLLPKETDPPHTEDEIAGTGATDNEPTDKTPLVDALEEENKKQFDFYLVVAIFVGAVIELIVLSFTHIKGLDLRTLTPTQMPNSVTLTTLLMIAITSFFMLANMVAFYLRIVTALVKDSDKGRAMSLGLAILALVLPYVAFSVERLWIVILGLLALAI